MLMDLDSTINVWQPGGVYRLRPTRFNVQQKFSNILTGHVLRVSPTCIAHSLACWFHFVRLCFRENLIHPLSDFDNMAVVVSGIVERS